MKRQRISTIVGALALCGSALFPGNVFAKSYTDESWGIKYNATGVPLSSSNVKKVEKTMTEIIPGQGVEVSTTSGAWRDGYIKGSGDVCRKYKYLEVNKNGLVGGAASFTITHGDYQMEIQIPKVGVASIGSLGINDYDDGFDDGETTAIGIAPQAFSDVENKKSGFSALYGGWEPYADTQCQTRVSVSGQPGKIIKSTTTEWEAGKAGNSNNVFHGALFVKMNIKLKRNGQPYTSSEIHFGIVDIDASQSFKILDADSQFTPNKIYADDLSKLQPQYESTDTQRLYNILVDQTGSYIYSQFNKNGGFDTKQISNIYVPITRETQENGLNVIFGYAGKAGSEIRYFSEQYNVTYKVASEGGGTVSRKTEKVVSGSNPLGSTANANEGYQFEYWTTDQAFKLGNKQYAVNDKIEMKDIKKIMVKDNYAFTAHFKKSETETKQYTVEYVPDKPGGDVTGITSEKVNEGENPSGSEAEADDGYTVSHWTTDQDVTLENGETIKKGEAISAEDIQKVVVDKDMKFIVHFEKKETPNTPNTPNTGAMSGSVDAATIATASVFGIVLIALAIKALPRLTHKKVNFD